MPICSKCSTLAGFATSCDVKQPGGHYNVFSIIPACWLEDVTKDVNGVITAVDLDTTNNPTAVQFQVEANKDTVVITEDLVLPNLFYNQTITFTISNYSDNVDKETAAQEQATFLKYLSNTSEGFVVVARDKMGVRRVYGETNPLFVTTLQKAHGAVNTDLAGTTITFAEGQPSLATAIDLAAVFTPSTGMIAGK